MPALTEGRHYFVDHTVPFYPGRHHLGKRDWTKKEREPGCMGEYEGYRQFDKGERPFVPPVARLVGSESCIERGGRSDTAPLTNDPLGLQRFHPAACYEPLTNSPCERIYRCPDIATIANIMHGLIVNPTWARIDAQTFVGPGAVATNFITPPGDRYSSSLVCVLGNEAWQWVEGTRDAGQLLAQAYGTAGGGTRYGPYTTSDIYHDYATEILSRFTAAGAADCTRWTIVGHSYGGAAASIAAARLKLSYPNRTIALCTFGAPRAGDARLIEILRGVCQTHLRRPNDPIPHLPPQGDFDLALLLLGPVLLPFMRVWGEYATYEYRRTIGPEGWIDEGPGEGPSNDVTSQLAMQIVSGVVSNWVEHDMGTYADELAIACFGGG